MSNANPSLVRAVLNALPGTAEEIEYDLFLNGVDISRTYARKILHELRGAGKVDRSYREIKGRAVGVWHKVGVSPPETLPARESA